LGHATNPASPTAAHSSLSRIARIDRRRRNMPERTAPTTAQPPKAAMSAPISPLARPWRLPITTTASISPVNTKFENEKINATVRRNGCRQRKRKPSAICERIRAVSASRSSWNGVRIATRVTTEKRYETASTTNGSARAMPKSAPPSGGPASRTTAMRACMAPAAVGIWRCGTTARIAPVEAMLKNAEAVPSTKAMPATSQIERRSSRIAAASVAIARACTTSAVSITRLRFHRSAATPASRPNIADGRKSAKPTMPAFDGECVNASTSSGYAIAVDCDPADESSWPACSRMKSRLR
jgi:hypothetical protein